ncbi:MAG TPA: hypothetical protein VF453_11175 [Burkholderiaceae bacterium]
MRLKANPYLAAALAIAAATVNLPSAEAASGTDISGTWERTPENWYGDNPDAPVLPGGPVKLKEPYATQYRELKESQEKANKAGTPIATTSARCLPEGMPTLMAGLFPLEILQSSRDVVVLGEYLQQVRRIWLGAKMPAPEQIQPSFNGQSVGHWEGDTLVVETRGVRTDTLLYDVPHSKDMKLTERIRLTAPDRLEDQVVIDDPAVLASPYRFTFDYRRSNYKIQEYVCENNEIAVDSEGKAHWKK